MGRKSNFEFYRILCILFIVIMHSFGQGVGQLNSTLGILVNVLGNIGVTGFVLLSGYFGIHLKLTKLAKLDFMMIFWGVTTTLWMYFHPGVFGVVGKRELVSAFLPFITHRYWFLSAYFIAWPSSLKSAYFILCLLSPFINEYLESINRRKHQLLIVVMGVVFLVLPTLFFFDQTGDGGKGVLNMLLTYVIGRYLGRYGLSIGKNYQSWVLGCWFLALVTVNFLGNYLLLHFFGVEGNYYARDNSLFTMMEAILLLLMIARWRDNVSAVNAFAKNIVAVYVLEDPLRCMAMRYFPHIFEEMQTSSTYLLFVVILAVAIFFVASILEELRKTVFSKAEDRVLTIISEKITERAILKWRK